MVWLEGPDRFLVLPEHLRHSQSGGGSGNTVQQLPITLLVVCQGCYFLPTAWTSIFQSFRSKSLGNTLPDVQHAANVADIAGAFRKAGNQSVPTECFLLLIGRQETNIRCSAIIPDIRLETDKTYMPASIQRSKTIKFRSVPDQQQVNSAYRVSISSFVVQRLVENAATGTVSSDHADWHRHVLAE